MIERLRAAREAVNERREVLPEKEVTLEKGDFAALVAAAWATIGKTAILTMGFFVAIAAILTLIWTL